MRRYVYVWADSIHLEARLEDEKQCIPRKSDEAVEVLEGADCLPNAPGVDARPMLY